MHKICARDREETKVPARWSNRWKKYQYSERRSVLLLSSLSWHCKDLTIVLRRRRKARVEALSL